METKSLGKKRQLLYLSIVAALIFLTFYVIHKETGHIDAEYLWSVFVQMNPKWLVLAAICMMLIPVLEGQCLTLLARPLGYKLSFQRATAYATANLYFAAITPSAAAGQPASGYYMVKDGIKGSDTTAILIMNVFQYTTSLLVLGIISVFIEWDFFLGTGWVFQSIFILGFVLQALLVVLCLICMVSGRLVEKLEKMATKTINKLKFIKRKEAAIARLNQYILKYQVGMTQMRKETGARTLALFGNFLQRFAFFAVGYCVYRSLGLDEIGFFSLVAIQCMLATITYNLPVPGGIGLSEGGFMWLFSSIYPAAVLTPAMLVTRGINYYLCFLLSGIYTLIHHIFMVRRNKRKKEQTS